MLIHKQRYECKPCCIFLPCLLFSRFPPLSLMVFGTFYWGILFFGIVYCHITLMIFSFCCIPSFLAVQWRQGDMKSDFLNTEVLLKVWGLDLPLLFIYLSLNTHAKIATLYRSLLHHLPPPLVSLIEHMQVWIHRHQNEQSYCFCTCNAHYSVSVCMSALHTGIKHSTHMCSRSFLSPEHIQPRPCFAFSLCCMHKQYEY